MKIAEQIARQFDDDGQRFFDRNGISLYCAITATEPAVIFGDHGARGIDDVMEYDTVTSSAWFIGDPVCHRFQDGSEIITTEDCWWLSEDFDKQARWPR